MSRLRYQGKQLRRDLNQLLPCRPSLLLLQLLQVTLIVINDLFRDQLWLESVDHIKEVLPRVIVALHHEALLRHILRQRNCLG